MTGGVGIGHGIATTTAIGRGIAIELNELASQTEGTAVADGGTEIGTTRGGAEIGDVGVGHGDADATGDTRTGHVDPRRWCSHSTKILMLAMTLPNLPGRTFTSALLMWEVRWS